MSCITPVRIKIHAAQSKPFIYEDAVLNSEYVGGYRSVPCGKCPECWRRRSNDWIIRLTQEQKRHYKVLFVTLTYAPEFVPVSECGRLTLNKRDVQLFIKRLRFNTGKKHIKYYLCGEYGSKTYRPHYHAIIFDVDEMDVIKAWTKDGKPIGIVDVEPPRSEGATCAYVTKYICKDKMVPQYQGDTRLREFSLMSKGLGANYLTPEMVQYHNDTLSPVFTDFGGYTKNLPRYYRDRIFDKNTRELIALNTQKKYNQEFIKQVRECGGVKEFYRRQYEMIRVINDRNKNINNLKRSKL